MVHCHNYNVLVARSWQGAAGLQCVVRPSLPHARQANFQPAPTATLQGMAGSSGHWQEPQGNLSTKRQNAAWQSEEKV